MNITAKISDTPNADILVERARTLVPALRQRAAQTLAERKLPKETIADFQRLGLTRCLQPAMFGGYGSDYRVFSKMLRALAKGCGSSAWVAAVHGEHSWVIGNYPEEAQREVWGKDPHAVASASVAPNGTAEKRLSPERPLGLRQRHRSRAVDPAGRHGQGRGQARAVDVSPVDL